MTKIAIYAGSFDPMTNGHLEILRASLNIADQLYVAIGVHPTKKALFTFEERVDFIYQSVKPLLKHDIDRLKVISFNNLLIDTARQVGATISIRGLRDGSDFDYEMQLSGMNEAMAPELQTVFLPAHNSVRAITSTLIRQIASMGGDVTPFVPKPVAEAIMKKYNK